MGYIKYRFAPMIKPAIEILTIFCAFGLWAMGGYCFTNYLWVPSFDEPLNNMFDDYGFYYTQDTRYENGYKLYFIVSICGIAAILDYNNYRKIGSKEVKPQ